MSRGASGSSTSSSASQVTRRGFQRKIVYLCMIGVLLLPLAWLSQPSVGATGGGKLSQLRDRYGLSPANLGQIDPTGEALKLATLGMRGVAAQILWWKAFNYQKEEQYNELSATNEQITKLMPNYVSAWRFQCWNLSYNVSVEFDDYRDRYFWVIKGINFLQDGIRYNQFEPRLWWDKGWFICHKIGRSDERKLFRVLFRKDDDFHGPDVPENLRDNWLVGKNYYVKASQLVDDEKPLIGMNPVVFHSDTAMAQINYSIALEEDGTFGERAAVAWGDAADDWEQFGIREFSTRAGTIKLSEYELYRQLAGEKRRALVAMAPTLTRQIYEARLAQLTPEEQALARKKAVDVTWQEAPARMALDDRLIPTPNELVAAMPAEIRPQAQKLADEFDAYHGKATIIDSYRNTVNYLYWQTRCASERTAEARAGRQAIFEGDKYFAEADLQRARASYEEGLRQWRIVLDKFPLLIDDGTTGDEMLRTTDRYSSILKQLDEPFPKPFILQDVLDKHLINKPSIQIPGNETVKPAEPADYESEGDVPPAAGPASRSEAAPAAPSDVPATPAPSEPTPNEPAPLETAPQATAA